MTPTPRRPWSTALRSRAALRPCAAIIAALLLAATLVALRASPAAAQERHYIANDDHTDYFWSGTDEDYRSAFLSMLDYYMQLAEDTANLPSDQRSRFNCDGSLWIYEFLQNRPQAQINRLMGHIRNGSITFPMQSLVTMPGAMPTEAVIRDMYLAGRLERRFGLDVDLVVAMENQTLPAGVASLWAGAGARFSWKGICGCVSRLELEADPRDHEIYHFAGPDGQSVLMKWNSLFASNESLGGYAEARDPRGVVNFMRNDPTFRQAWPWPVAAAFGYGWDDLSSTTDAFVRASQALGTPDRRVIVSNEVDFFEDFLASHGDEIPTFTGSYGNEWDLLTASLGEVSAGMRRSVERLRGAEAMAAVVALYAPEALDLESRAAQRDRAFLDMGLFYDHDWTANSGIGQEFREGFQRDTLASVKGYTDGLHDDALGALAGAVANPEPSRGAPFVVFNPLSWPRTDVAFLPVEGGEALHAVEEGTGEAIPSQRIALPGGALLAVMVPNVPALGYKVVRVLAGAGPAFPDAAVHEGDTLDGPLVRLTLGDDGAITSLIDHCHDDRQLVPEGGALNRRTTGGQGGAVTLEALGPVLATLRVAVPGSPGHTTRVTLYAGLNRIDVEDRITGNFGQETGYRFDLDMSDPTIRHEEVGMIATVDRISNGGTYADRQARTDYLTLGHFVSMSDAGLSATLSSWDSAFMKVGQSTVDTLDADTASITAIVGMQVDGPDLGFRNQGGDAAFLNRYALRTHAAYDPAAAMRFALAHQNPLIAAPLTGDARGPLPADAFSLLTLDNPDVLAFAVKPAEEGIEGGVIARLWNLSEAPAGFSLAAALPMTRAVEVTHVETDIAPVAVADDAIAGTLARQQLKTFRLLIGARPDPPVDPPDADDAGLPDLGVGDVDEPIDAAEDVPVDDIAIDTPEGPAEDAPVDDVAIDAPEGPDDVATDDVPAAMDADLDDLCADLPPGDDPRPEPEPEPESDEPEPNEPEPAPAPTPPSAGDGGGCCATLPARPGSAPWLLAGLGLILALARRRSRR